MAGDKYRYLFVVFWYRLVSRWFVWVNSVPLNMVISRNIPVLLSMVPVVLIVGYTLLNLSL